MLKTLRPILITLLFLSTVLVTVKVYDIETERRSIKEDLIELSKIKYGLFNVDEWKLVLAKIITQKIDEFDLEGANREKMKVEITSFLYKQINDFEAQYYEEQGQTFIGFLKSGVAAITNTFGEIKRRIPYFTEEILDFMNEPKNRNAIKEFIIKKLDDYANKTFSKTDYTARDHVVTKYNFTDAKSAKVELELRDKSSYALSQSFRMGLIIMITTSGLFILLLKKLSNYEFLILTLISISLLIMGLLLPMIEIDARISNMSFSLLGESVSFSDQVLYYKSKSILEVVQLLMYQDKFDLLIVGLLILTFSVLFPIAKSVCSIIYLYSIKLRSNPFVQFVVFKTGKWSMADVMVIAIFMAYIGFSGVITEQLNQLSNFGQNIDVLTTNESHLMLGFYLFTSFVILSLLTSHKLQNQQNDTSN